MTEDEAKDKWCPQARYQDFSNETAANRFSDANQEKRWECRCMGSECMAWRWATIKRNHMDAESTGYCGLAGKP